MSALQTLVGGYGTDSDDSKTRYAAARRAPPPPRSARPIRQAAAAATASGFARHGVADITATDDELEETEDEDEEEALGALALLAGAATDLDLEGDTESDRGQHQQRLKHPKAPRSAIAHKAHARPVHGPPGISAAPPRHAAFKPYDGPYHQPMSLSSPESQRPSVADPPRRAASEQPQELPDVATPAPHPGVAPLHPQAAVARAARGPAGRDDALQAPGRAEAAEGRKAGSRAEVDMADKAALEQRLADAKAAVAAAEQAHLEAKQAALAAKRATLGGRLAGDSQAAQRPTADAHFEVEKQPVATEAASMTEAAAMEVDDAASSEAEAPAAGGSGMEEGHAIKKAKTAAAAATSAAGAAMAADAEVDAVGVDTDATPTCQMSDVAMPESTVEPSEALPALSTLTGEAPSGLTAGEVSGGTDNKAEPGGEASKPPAEKTSRIILHHLDKEELEQLRRDLLRGFLLMQDKIRNDPVEASVRMVLYYLACHPCEPAMLQELRLPDLISPLRHHPNRMIAYAAAGLLEQKTWAPLAQQPMRNLSRNAIIQAATAVGAIQVAT